MSGKAVWILPVWAGLALCLSFPSPSLFFLAWGALVPFLAFIRQAEGKRVLLAGHFLMASIYFGGVLYWIPGVLTNFGGIGSLTSWSLWGLMVLALGVFLLPFTLLSFFASGYGREVFLLTAPAWWMLTEFLRNYLAVNGFPWAALGYSQFPFTLLTQGADLGGVYLVSGLVVLINSVILALFWSEKRVFLGGGAVILLLVFYGGFRLWAWTPTQTGVVRVGLLQGDIALQESREYYADKYFSVLPRLAERAWSEGAEWIILPEAQCPYYFEDDFYFRTFWERKSDQLGSSILLNSTRMDREEAGRYYNSAYLLAPGRGVTHVYDKVHLVPFGEFVPFASLLSFASPLVAEVSNYTPGKEISTGTVNGYPFGTLICYEDVFPELGRANAANGAQILVNISNDLWYGDTAAPEQHLQIASFRSIETRRSLLRGTNSGITAVIDPQGRVEGRTGLFSEDVLVSEARFYSDTSLFTMLGDIPGMLLIAASGGYLFYLVRRRGREAVDDPPPSAENGGPRA